MSNTDLETGLTAGEVALESGPESSAGNPPASQPASQPASEIVAETLALLEWPRLGQHLATFAATKLGAIAARNLLPPADRATSQARLAETIEAVTLEQGLAGGLNFNGIEDIGGAIQRAAHGGLLAGPELLAVATTLAGVRGLRRIIEAQDDDLSALAAWVAEVRTYPELEQEIHRCIDDRGEVSDRASPELAALRQQMRQTHAQIYERLQRLLQRNARAIQEATIVQRGDRFVIPVKASHRAAIPGLVHDSSASGATLYIEPHAITETNNRLRQLSAQATAAAEAVCRRLSEAIGEVAEDLAHLLAVATAIDLAVARARYSLWLEGNPPQFVTPGEAMSLTGLRHPLLIWQERQEQGRPVVAIDLPIEPRTRVVAITGPNTGGKTVALKTLGLAVLMAKCGLFVPARDPVALPWFEQVLADIGDEQSIEQSLSTFSGHIRRIGRILAALDGSDAVNSLVLLDEVGAGTDPDEGSALAAALLRGLADRARLSVATTHFGELKTLKYSDDRFENASVEFDEASLSPTYRLLWGIPGRSNALTIAERLGLDPTIVQAARDRLGSSSADLNETIAGLERERRRQEAKANEVAHLLERAEFLHGQIDRKAKLLKERETELKQTQERAVQQEIEQARQAIAEVIANLQRAGASAPAAARATAEVVAIADRALPSRQPKPAPPDYCPTVGERVRVPRLGGVAEVVAVEGDDRELTVRLGSMKATLSFEDIESLAGQKVPPPPPKSPPKSPPAAAKPTVRSTVRTSHNTIDLRGQRVMDAEIELERAIAGAIAADSGAVWIIHGKGTGKLRQGIQAWLDTHGLIERHELASTQDGGSGVTIAYLRGGGAV